MARWTDTHVAIIGAGAAGLTAAIGLARLGVRVTLIEGARKPGAENWSGAVYFCENLARPEILGAELLAQTPLERRVQRRGLLVCDGERAVGAALKSERAFRHVHTVLRPLFDQDLAAKAVMFGATLLADTTAIALLRTGTRITGVLTDRGPIDADLVFLAEGDASHLVSREGLETIPAGAKGLQRPAFLQGIKEVLALPAGVIDERFGLAPGEGACFEILLRNGTVDGRPVPLNAGAFLYTNRESISLGLVMPLENLGEFKAPHHRLMEWLKALPPLRPFLEGARTLGYGAKLIRGGGHLQRPRLVMDGLAVGGAAGGFGVDFPAPNYTGPATYCGWALTTAVRHLVDIGHGFDAASLEATYVATLRDSRYWKDEETLAHWPEFVATTRVFFDAQAAVLPAAVDALTRRDGSVVAARAAAEAAAGMAGLAAVREEGLKAARALQAQGGLVASALSALPLQILNTFLPSRATRAAHDETVIPLYWGATREKRELPLALQARAPRLAAGLAAALFELYRNDATPLSQKFALARDAVLRRLTLGDLVALPWAWWRAKPAGARPPALPAPDYLATPPRMEMDARLGLLEYRGEGATHIRFSAQRDDKGVPDHLASPLFTVCPARVYEHAPDPSAAGSVAVLHENCIRCESCWRADDRHVDWGRTRTQRTHFAVSSPAAAWLEESLAAAALAAATGREPPPLNAPASAAAAPEALSRLHSRLTGFLAHMRSAPAVLTGRQQADLLRHAQALAQLLEEAADTASGLAASDARALAAALRLHAGAGRFFQCEADALLVRDQLLARLGGSVAPPRHQRDAAGATQLLREALAARFPRTELFAADDASELTPALQAELLAVLMGMRDPEEDRARAAVRALAGLSPALGWLAAETLLARALADRAGIPLDEAALCGIPEGEWTATATTTTGLRVSGSGFGLTLPSRQLLCCAARLVLVATPLDAARPGSLGLRAARPGRITFVEQESLASAEDPVNAQRARRLRDGLIVQVALGSAEVLERRALDHAASRVQFPGLFRDLRGRDGVAKFGAVGELLGGIASATTTLRALAADDATNADVAPLAIRLFGPGPRSVAYLAGQVLGGTAYSEEDEVGRWFRDASAFGRVVTDLQGTALVRAAQFETLGVEPVAIEAPAGFAELASQARSASAACKKVRVAVHAQGAGEQAAVLRDVARVADLVLAARALAKAHETRCADGHDGVAERGALEWTLTRLERKASALAERAADASALMALGAAALERGLDAAAVRGSYAALLADDSRWSSGDAATSLSAGATPELAAADPLLVPAVTPRADWVAKGTRAWRRALEERHQLAPEDIADLQRRGAFRMVIPEELGGLGLSKLAYYGNCAVMARHGDISESIVVMGSMSIGCLPIVIGLEEDLPATEAALARLLTRATELRTIVTEGTREQGVALAKDLGRDKALRAMTTPLRKALEAAQPDNGRLPALADAMLARAQVELAELAHREAALRFFLKLLASGRISAFALTEPSAGSDTARVRTRAELVRVVAEQDARGFFRFTPAEGTEQRALFLRESFRFNGAEIFWRDATGREHPVEWRDRGAGGGPQRSVLLDGERIAIHDLGRVTREGERFSYAYWRVQGAKMWITNASIAGVMILYARTTSGISAFALDAHAEGLFVGRDEHKLGQRGSTTNELVLNDVRIPLDQLIGTEGRGQENALETLNVGRTGLAFISAAEMHGLVDSVRGLERARLTTPAFLHAFGRAALDLLATESLATCVTGRLDHPGTQSIRMDSAAAKTLGTEALQRVLTRLEEVLPREAVLESMDFEKRRRDSRVLSIYEGTNEVQRFLLARDVLDGFDAQPLAVSAPAPGSVVTDLRGVAEALRKDASLQPIGFMGADAFIETAAENSLARRAAAASTAEQIWAHMLAEAAALVTADATRRAGARAQQVRSAVAELRRGMEPLLVHLADTALGEPEVQATAVAAEGLTRKDSAKPLRVAVLVDPAVDLLAPAWSHTTHFTHGERSLSDRDRAVLLLARRLRDEQGAEVALFAAGTANGIPVLREALALAGDSALLMEERSEGTLAASLAEAFAEAVSFSAAAAERDFDLVLAHEALAGVALPLAARLSFAVVAGVHALRVVDAGEAFSFTVAGSEGAEGGAVRGPALVLCAGSVSEAAFRFSISDWRRALALDIGVVPAPCQGISASLRVADQGSTGETQPQPLQTDSASLAAHCLALAGGGGAATAEAHIEATGMSLADLAGAEAIALVSVSAEGSPAPGARAAIAAAHALHSEPLVVAIIQTHVPEAVASAARELASRGAERVAFLIWPEFASAGLNTQAAALRPLLALVRGSLCVDEALRWPVLLAAPPGIRTVDGVDTVAPSNATIHIEGPRHGGRMRMTAELELRPVLLVTSLQWKGIKPPARTRARAGAVAWPWSESASPLDAALMRATAAVGGRLADAEFVIDVGFGVGGRDGLEEVVEPLRQALLACGVRGVMIGATRKVTLDLGILPASQQIGQTGVRVAPRVLLALGVSGAPQHMGWIADTTVIFVFNKDADAPLMQWNRTRTAPLVIPIPGDLFREVPRFIAALRATHRSQS